MTLLRKGIKLPFLSVTLSGAALAVLLTEAPTALRAPVVLAFALMGPGLSVLQFCRFGKPTADLTFVLAAGFTLLTLLTAVMLYLAGWSPRAAMLSLALLCTVLALARLGLRLKPLGRPLQGRHRVTPVGSGAEGVGGAMATGGASQSLGPRAVQATPCDLGEGPHALVDLACISVLAVLCGANTYGQIHQYALAKEAWLRTFLELPSGVPSSEAFVRFFAALRPEAWQQHFLGWTRALVLPALAGVGGDRQTSGVATAPKGLHGACVWPSRFGLILAQRSFEASTTFLELCDVVAVDGAVMTTDAIAAHAEVTGMLRAKRAHYVWALKDYPKLLESVRGFFEYTERTSCSEHSYLKTSERRRGCEESRECWVTPVPEWLPGRETWRDLASLIRLRSSYTADDITNSYTRYFLSSLPLTAERVLRATRLQDGRESGWRWLLEIPLEEGNQVRRQNARANWVALRRLAGELLAHDDAPEGDAGAKRLRAGWDHAYLQKLLAPRVSQ